MSSESQPSAPAVEAPATIKTGAQIVVDTLVELGVETMFGYTGGVVLPLFDRLYDAPIRFIIPRHEQGGCHMADAYARASGKVGVVIATSGPGACNLTTGLGTAMMDSVPLVAITGQVRTDLIGNDAFQEADTTGITRPVTKYNSIVKDIKDLERTVREAFHIASTGRPGPVLIDVPVDISVGKCQCNGKAAIDLPGYRIRTKGHARQISMAAEAINKAERPVLYVGGGVVSSNASEELAGLGRKGPYARDHDAAGPGHLRPAESRVARHARHARLRVRQLRGPGVRPAHRHRGPVRRPRHRQGRHLRPARQGHPYRYRPGEHLEECPGRYPGRRRRQAHPDGADERGRVPRATARGSPRSPSGRRSTPSATTSGPRRSSRNT